MANEQNLKPFPRGDNSSDPLADNPVQVRLSKSVDAAVRAVPNRSEWLRRVISEAAQRELMADQDAS
jgi:hypothetical protein